LAGEAWGFTRIRFSIHSIKATGLVLVCGRYQGADALGHGAKKAGRTTASVQWPVTVVAKITWDIPELWRAGDANDLKLDSRGEHAGMLEEAEKEIGTFAGN